MASQTVPQIISFYVTEELGRCHRHIKFQFHKGLLQLELIHYSLHCSVWEKTQNPQFQFFYRSMSNCAKTQRVCRLFQRTMFTWLTYVQYCSVYWESLIGAVVVTVGTDIQRWSAADIQQCNLVQKTVFCKRNQTTARCKGHLHTC